MSWITLATEDALSEAVGRRLVEELEGRLEIDQFLRRSGFGYLRSRIPSFCEMARHRPVLLITDLDQKQCAGELLDDWLGTRSRPESLLLRVAVREVESWLLADHIAIRTLFRKPLLRLPANPEELSDPKQYLIQLAKTAPRHVREAIVPEEGAVSSQGLGYNELLTEAVRDHWSPHRAAQHSNSLHRARRRLRELALRAPNMRSS